MTYEDWCKNHKEWLKLADDYNNWRRRSTSTLLSDIGPRIDRLSKVMYMGCGFHYSLEQSFGKLINSLSMPFQPCANWCAKIEDDWTTCQINHVLYESLIEQVEKAEASVTKP